MPYMKPLEADHEGRRAWLSQTGKSSNGSTFRPRILRVYLLLLITRILHLQLASMENLLQNIIAEAVRRGHYVILIGLLRFSPDI